MSICLHRRGDDEQGDYRLLVMGPVSTPRTFTPGPGETMQAVRVAPEWARALIGPTAAELNDTVAPMTDVIGPDARTLRSRLLSERSIGPLFGWFEARRHRASDPEALFVGAALDRVMGRSEGRGEPLWRVARDLGVSTRHLRRILGRVIGRSAKTLQRVHRLTEVVEAADRYDQPRWSSLAVAHGFYDQAHLIQECRALTGDTPVEVHRHRRAEHVRFFQDARPEPS
ncbi:MAG: AraC family transcriptional regulator [Gemmatimonadetes bacterium]|nr:AraC family transcriptional regulator [Gemmatimonadota bacterium]